MRTLIIGGMCLIVTAGCASSKPGGQRLAEDVGCAVALAAQGAALSKNASASTVIASIQDKSQDPTVMANCAGLFQNLGGDLAALQAQINAKKAAPAAAPTK